MRLSFKWWPADCPEEKGRGCKLITKAIALPLSLEKMINVSS
jgi:hypothetical protein